jgi:hypothetical protein
MIYNGKYQNRVRIVKIGYLIVENTLIFLNVCLNVLFLFYGNLIFNNFINYVKIPLLSFCYFYYRTLAQYKLIYNYTYFILHFDINLHIYLYINITESSSHTYSSSPKISETSSLPQHPKSKSSAPIPNSAHISNNYSLYSYPSHSNY